MESPPEGQHEPTLEDVEAWVFERSHLVYLWFAATFAVVLVLTNVIGTKLFHFHAGPLSDWLNDGQPLTLTAGIITYPITFWLTDIVSEIWGRKRANAMVILGFGMSLLMLVIVQAAKALEPSPYWGLPEVGFPDGQAMQGAMDAFFANPHILLFASMTAYLVAQLFDVRLYHFWWRVTKGKYLWVRNNGSTLISQLVDTIIVNGIFLRWGLDMEWGAIGRIIVAVYICKGLMAMLDTPFIYLGVFIVSRALGLERGKTPARAPLA
jgi:uncharacterized integral membrane protein (TIGR00697 family)